MCVCVQCYFMRQSSVATRGGIRDAQETKFIIITGPRNRWHSPPHGEASQWSGERKQEEGKARSRAVAEISAPGLANLNNFSRVSVIGEVPNCLTLP